MIRSYSYKPIPKFKTAHDEFDMTSDVKELLFGVELEIDKGSDPEDTSDEMLNACEDIYCKHDGSLGCNGIEIVTHPCTLEYHMNCLPWEKIAKIAKDHDYRSHDTRRCGLHVHVGRFQMGMFEEERDKTAAKVVLLVVRFWDQMVKFSRRTDSQLSDWACLPDVSSNVKEYIINEALRTESDGRYQAVNLCNSSTIEFRLFNGTLNMDTLKATLQLVSNIVSYAKVHDLDDVLECQWKDITDYEVYPELEAYLNDRGLSFEPEMKPWTFKYETGDEYRAELEKIRLKREQERLEDERRRREEFIARAAERESAINASGFRIGDRVRIVNAEGNDVNALRYLLGEEATITAFIISNNTYANHEVEVRFDDTPFARMHCHYANYSSGSGSLYYNVYFDNLELADEPASENVRSNILGNTSTIMPTFA